MPDPPVVDPLASWRLIRRLATELAHVGIDEFQSQETRFDDNSRLGRELLYLAANDQWLRAGREIVALHAVDTIDTRLNIHVDLALVTHEAFRDRTDRLWLPLAVLPPPVESASVTAPTRPRIVPSPTVRDAHGTVLPSLPQSEARRWVAAALSEIILTLAPVALDGDSPAARLAREQRLLLSAALFRLLRDPEPTAAAPAPTTEPTGSAPPVEHGHRRTRIQLARADLLALLARTGTLIAGTEPELERSRLLMGRAVRLVAALRAPTTLVVLGVDASTRAGVFSVEVVGRPLVTHRALTPHGPRARIDLDVLLPATAADHAVIVSLPEGLSFGGRGGAPLVEAVDVVARPPALTQIEQLSRQLAPEAGPLPEDGVARCLVDFTLARFEAVRDTFRHYRTVSLGRHGAAEHPLGPDALPLALGAYRTALAQIGSENVAVRAAAAARTYLAAGPPSMTEYRRMLNAGTVSPHRAHVRLPPVENRTVRATPVRATVHLYVKADSSAPLHAARIAGLLSLVLLGSLLACRIRFGEGSSEVMASVLTLFAAIQASRIQNPDRSTLRGQVIASGLWVIVASILPTVLLGVALAFTEAVAVMVVAFLAQVALQVLMFLPILTGRAWRRGSQPWLRFNTGQPLDHPRTDVLHEPWWRSTTAGSLLLGTEAHAYVVPQHGSGMGDLLAAVPQLGSPTRAANILGMLRSATATSSLTFLVLREEPEPAWLAGRLAPVNLDVDRLTVSEVPVGTLDVHLGLRSGGYGRLAGHPVRRLLDVVGARGLHVLDVQLPAPPPHGGDPALVWARARIGLRTDEVEDLVGILAPLHGLARADPTQPLDLLVDMSGQTPPRRFSGTRPTGGEGPVHPRDLDVLRPAPGAGAAGDLDWVTLAAYDYVRPGVENALLDLLAARHPRLRLAGLTTARLHGVAVLFLLGTSSSTSAGTGTGAPIADRRILLHRPLTTAELGRSPTDGVLLRVHARYSDRPRLFAELLEDLAHGFSALSGTAYAAAHLHLAYLHTEVADGRTAVTRFMVVLPGADPRRFERVELDRIERSARRALTRAQVVSAHDGSAPPVAKALVTIQVLSTPPPGRSVDLRDRPAELPR